MGDIFKNPDVPFPEKPIGKCPLTHCYNGHALLKLGLVPQGAGEQMEQGYGDIRNRRKVDGEEWLKPELLDFFNSRCAESNPELSENKKKMIMWKAPLKHVLRKAGRIFQK